MEKLMGQSVKDFLYSAQFESDSGEIQYGAQAQAVAYEIGRVIAKMHDADIIHGDLTTSNMMFRSADNAISSLVGGPLIVMVDWSSLMNNNNRLWLILD